MKKILLGCFIVFIAFLIFLDTKDYILGDTLTKQDVQSDLYAGEYPDYTQAEDAVRDSLHSKVSNSASYGDQLYILPNNQYYVLKTLVGTYKSSQYLYTGIIERKGSGETTLTFPAHGFNLISVNDKFKQKSWDIKSKAGIHHFRAGDFNQNDNPEDKVIMNNQQTEGITETFTPNKDVIVVSSDGLWLDHRKNKMGMAEMMNAYPSEQEAVKAVKKDTFGRKIGILKSKHMDFYIYKYQLDTFSQYTIIPVRVKDNQFYAGKFERFTYVKDDEFSSEFEEQVDGITYKLNFQQNKEKFKQYNEQLKSGGMRIAVEVRGENDGK